MIKASAMFSAHAVHVLLRNTLIFLIIFFIALFLWLQHGIQIDKLALGEYKVEKLYLKLDKKFILKAENLNIPISKEKPSFENIDKTFDRIKYLVTFFETIDLKNITFKDNKIDIFFTDEILYLSSDDYKIVGNIVRKGKKFTADISQLSLKKYDIEISGKLHYDLGKHYLYAEGDFDVYSIKGSFLANKKNDNIHLKLSSKNFKELRPLINRLTLNDKIKSWILDKIKVEEYILLNLEGDARLKDDGLKINFKSLSANMLLKKVKIYYKDSLEPIVADNCLLTYKNKSLYFDFKNPKYKDKSLQGSKVSMLHLASLDTVLKLDLHMITGWDKSLKKVLAAYKVNIPVKYKGNDLNVMLMMDIPLGKYKKKRKSKILLTVDAEKSSMWYKDIKLPLEKAHITYNNTIAHKIKVSTVLRKGNVHIGQTKIPVLSGKGSYIGNSVILEEVHIKDHWYDGTLSGKVDTLKKYGKLTFMVKKVSIGDVKKFIIIKNKKLPVSFDFSKKIDIDIPSLALAITNRKKDIKINITDIKKIKPYLQNIDLSFDGGVLNIIKKDTQYSFTGEIERKACFFYDKNGQCHTKIPCIGKIDKGNIDFYAFGKRLYYNSTKSRIKLKGIHIDLKKFLDSRDKYKNKKTKSKKLIILGQNSKIRYGKYKLVTDSYDIEISPKGNVKAVGSLDGDIVKFSRKDNIFNIKALRVKDKMLHPLIGFNGLKKGRYTLKMLGNPDKKMKGEIIVEGGALSGFKAYNNTIALLNTLPALATLNNPGFSEDGFRIKEGVVEYRMYKDKIIFDSIYIRGNSSTIVGKGSLNLKNKTINIKLAIQTARELGKLVGKVPLLGYILMGKDKSITIGLTIRGTLNKPIVKTSAAQDILTLPLQIIKRTLESPIYIMNK